jgi:ABC-type multidrug transport system fused ATPase/permease subunit
LSRLAHLLYYAAMEKQPASGLDIGLWAGLRELYMRLSSARHREFMVLVGFMFLGGIAELATIGSIIPFLALVSPQGGTVHLPRSLAMIAAIGPAVGLSGVVATATVFAAFAIVAGLIRLELSWLTQHFVNRTGHELALDVQRRILSQPYSFHVEQHSSSFISATDKVEIVVFDLGLPLLQTIIAVFVGLFLVAALLAINPLATIVATITFGLVYVIVATLVGKRLDANSAVVGTTYHHRLRVEQESLGGIRDVIIDNSQAMHLDMLDRVNSQLVRARATTNFMAQAPRSIVEAAGVIVIVVIAVVLSRQAGGIALAIPFLGALAVGAQRLLPLIQTAYAGWSVGIANRSIVGQIVELLRLPVPPDDERLAPLPLKDRIRFDAVSFSYPGRPHAPAIDSVSFEISRGSMVAFTGRTGSGKTTLADLLMGLVQPTSGRILIDQLPLTPETAPRWRKSIAHVAQTIFLADSSIAANVALSKGSEPPDLERVAQALKIAQLDEFVASLPDGHETVVGERGIRLSGGQRQRLGLARAIYKDAPVLVLDEATSALDDLTESKVVETLQELKESGRTIVIIAHRMSTISKCDLIVKLDEGRLANSGSIADVLGPTARLATDARRRARSGAARSAPRGKHEGLSGS